MRIFRHLENTDLPVSACAIGMFDGIHVGHQMVLESALRQARLLGVPSAVFTFANHPQHLLSQTPTPLLSSLEERLSAFEAMGFENALVLTFDATFQTISAPDFVKTILCKHLGVKSVSVGYDFHFGHNREGTPLLLREWGNALGFDVQLIEPVRANDPLGKGQIVSSTLLRKLLSYGDVETAKGLLGRAYSLPGVVVQGFNRGRGLGFPTANLQPQDSHRLVPALGTYGGIAILADKQYPAVCNIGFSPTFETPHPVEEKRVEVHLLDYDGPAFYDQPLTMAFHLRLRDESKFPSPEALAEQIQKDCDLIRGWWQKDLHPHNINPSHVDPMTPGNYDEHPVN